MQEISFTKSIIVPVDNARFVTNPISAEIPIYSTTTQDQYVSNSFQIAGTTYDQSIKVGIRHTTLRSLRCYVDIVSLPEVPPTVPGIQDTDESLAIKQRNTEAQYPAFLMEMILQRIGTPYRIVVGRFRLQNKRPGYYLNLLRFFTPNNAFRLEDSAIIASIVNVGFGYPRTDDLIDFWGEVLEEGHYEPLILPKQDLELSGSIAAELSGSFTSGEQQNNSLFRVKLSGNVQSQVTIFFISGEPTTNEITVSTELPYTATNSTSFVDLTDFVTQNGVGTYVFVPSNGQQIFNTFLNASIQMPQGYKQAYGLNWIQYLLTGTVEVIIIRQLPIQLDVVVEFV